VNLFMDEHGRDLSVYLWMNTDLISVSNERFSMRRRTPIVTLS
jgi:hypothetical protein